MAKEITQKDVQELQGIIDGLNLIKKNLSPTHFPVYALKDMAIQDKRNLRLYGLKLIKLADKIEELV